MIFNTLAYFFCFLLPAAVLFRLASPAVRPWVCVGSGAAFFLFFSLGLPGGVYGAACLGLFVWEALISRLYRPGSRWCVAGVAVSLGALAIFKYWNFLTGLLAAPFVAANPWAWPGAFLPLGISFFTFEFIHYAVDRYQGRVERGTLGEYLAFIFFFPTMVAGPIKRFQDFAPCLRHPTREWATDWNRGITRILFGLAKKFALADLLTSVTDHLNAADVAHATGRGVLLLWLFAYGWKIYFDFSAYSDIAIGSGRLFGLKIPENFEWPYFRTSIAEFWKHWHISLYRWLVDYVFIPVGGSRGRTAFVCRNVLIVMLASGIWHGAGANFVVWGAYHGLLLIVQRLWSGRRPLAPDAPLAQTHAQALAPEAIHPTWPRRLGGWALTYGAVNLGWAFFAMDLPTAGLFYRRLLFG